MPLILTDTAKVVVNDYVVRKPLREKVVVTSVNEPIMEQQEDQTVEQVVEPIRTHVVNISPKKVVSSYRQDLLTSQK